MYIAANPTKIYTIFCRIGIDPKSVSTTSNSSNPTNSQFKPPIITRTKAIQSKTFLSAILSPPQKPISILYYINLSFYLNIKMKYTPLIKHY